MVIECKNELHRKAESQHVQCCDSAFFHIKHFGDRVEDLCSTIVVTSRIDFQ